MLTVLFGFLGFQQAQVFADGCRLVRQETASGMETLGVHLNRFFSPASAGLFLLPF
jgi:hypothetical protein